MCTICSQCLQTACLIANVQLNVCVCFLYESCVTFSYILSCLSKRFNFTVLQLINYNESSPPLPFAWERRRGRGSAWCACVCVFITILCHWFLCSCYLSYQRQTVSYICVQNMFIVIFCPVSLILAANHAKDKLLCTCVHEICVCNDSTWQDFDSCCQP